MKVKFQQKSFTQLKVQLHHWEEEELLNDLRAYLLSADLSAYSRLENLLTLIEAELKANNE